MELTQAPGSQVARNDDLLSVDLTIERPNLPGLQPVMCEVGDQVLPLLLPSASAPTSTTSQLSTNLRRGIAEGDPHAICEPLIRLVFTIAKKLQTKFRSSGALVKALRDLLLQYSKAAAAADPKKSQSARQSIKRECVKLTSTCALLARGCGWSWTGLGTATLVRFGDGAGGNSSGALRWLR